MSFFKNIRIYYFSGTGNSANVAKWIHESALKHDIDSEMINITFADRRNLISPTERTLIVFISPVHGFNFPPVMLNFIAHFPRGKNNVVILNTRAGMLIGKFITPGLSGISLYLSSLILRIKGYRVQGLFPVDLPSNWMSLHPSLNDRTVEYLHIKNKEKVLAFSDTIFEGKTYFKALREIIPDLIISPIALLYYLIGRFLFAKTFYASATCNKCYKCINECPVKAIETVNKRPYWTFNCESCMKCMSSCPKRAIETAHGFIICVLFLSSSLIEVWFYSLFTSFFFKIENEIIEFLINAVLILLFLKISYRAMHFALKYKFFERLVYYTSFTHFKFWGRRYRALKKF